MSTTVIATSGPGKTPVWAETMRRWTDYFVKDFGDGPRPWKFAWVINFQKTGTFPMLAFVIGWLLISGIATPKYPLPGYAWFSLCILGCAIMIASDAQKYFTLRFKRDLITIGASPLFEYGTCRRFQGFADRQKVSQMA